MRVVILSSGVLRMRHSVRVILPTTREDTVWMLRDGNSTLRSHRSILSMTALRRLNRSTPPMETSRPSLDEGVGHDETLGDETDRLLDQSISPQSFNRRLLIYAFPALLLWSMSLNLTTGSAGVSRSNKCTAHSLSASIALSWLGTMLVELVMPSVPQWQLVLMLRSG